MTVSLAAAVSTGYGREAETGVHRFFVALACGVGAEGGQGRCK